jgi:hypothetical protein
MRQLILSGVVPLFVACNTTADPNAEAAKKKGPSYSAGDPRAKEAAEQAATAVEAPEHFGGADTTPDWSGKKLVDETGVVDDLVFTIKVPEGLPRHSRNKGDWDDGKPNHDHMPKVFTQTFEIRRIKSLDDAKYFGTLDARSQTWTREKEVGASIELTMAKPDKSRVEAIVYKHANDTHYIRCKAVQATGGEALPSYDKTKQMLESICDSLKVKGPVPE